MIGTIEDTRPTGAVYSQAVAYADRPARPGWPRGSKSENKSIARPT